jgi:phosphotransferase system HPr (HPr) family protein
MSRETPIARRQVQIEDAFGLRMKTAAEFICLAGRFRSDVWIIHEGRRYNGRSMRDLLNIGTECGSRLELEAQGPDAEEALTALAQAVRPSAMERVTNLSP